jgi:hypothetical protein
MEGNIKMVHTETGLEGVNWIQMVLDRVKWRFFCEHSYELNFGFHKIQMSDYRLTDGSDIWTYFISNCKRIFFARKLQ